MPQQINTSVENNFTKGFITEATGLNFPENAATSASNCEFTIVGDTVRRLGIDVEENGSSLNVNPIGLAVSTYIWNNPGGDGNAKLLVRQVGGILYFYKIYAASPNSPLSTQRLGNTVSLSYATPVGGIFDTSIECQYADGNGYLFVFHPNLEPQYISYNVSQQTFTLGVISVTTRDFTGVNDGLVINTRPSTLTSDHQYNLINQGWTTGNPWLALASNSYTVGTTGSTVFTVASGMSGVSNGQQVSIATGNDALLTNPVFAPPGIGQNFQVATGTVTNYTGTSLTINISSVSTSDPRFLGQSDVSWYITPYTSGYINTFFAAAGVYPSNADVWWYFKNSSGAFDPATTITNVNLNSAQSPQGHVLTPAFHWDRSSSTGISVGQVSTFARPATGAWFQGRMWCTGVNALQAASTDTSQYSWNENIYFSQITTNPLEFGNCFQVNDPTAEDFNSLLPTDGGVITVVGSGTIHKLFPIANGLLVFANNGVWFITGSTGIGFAANDYTISKISSVKVLSSNSFVDVLGLPFFWNEEGIYQVMTQQNGSLSVEPITVGTILSYYNAIPKASKKYARGDYDPINYVIQWSFRSTPESNVSNRYQYDTILNFNTYNKAFYPYDLSNTGTQFINGVVYVSYPYLGNDTPEPGFKYPCVTQSSSQYFLSFAEEFDTSYLDWGVADYTSTFTTGYKLHGGAWRKFQIPYLYTYSRNDGYSAFYVQSVWDYGINFDSNKWSSPQFVEINDANAGVVIRRHRLRGRGEVLQLKITSVSGQPFDLMGWAVYETMNTGA